MYSLTPEPAVMPLEQLFAQVLGVRPEQLDDTSNPTTVAEWSSLMTVHILVATEQEYGLRFDKQESSQLWSLGDFRKALHRRGILA